MTALEWNLFEFRGAGGCEVCTWPASACATAGAKMARMGSAKYPSADTLQVNASARVEWNCAWKYKLCTVSGWLCLENQVLESFELGKRMHLAQQQKKKLKWKVRNIRRKDACNGTDQRMWHEIVYKNAICVKCQIWHIWEFGCVWSLRAESEWICGSGKQPK